jgi:hypothetical protein
MTYELLFLAAVFVAPPATDAAEVFDLPEDQEHRLEPGTRHGTVRVSKVNPGDYLLYLSFENQGNAANIEFVRPRAPGKLVAQRRRGTTLYYAIKSEKRVTLPGADSGRPNETTVTVIQRYKVDLPPGDKPFLGLADNQLEKVPSGALKGLVKVSKVIPADHAHYLKAKRTRDIAAQQRRGAFIYYAVDDGLDVPFPDGPTAWLNVTKRYIARTPVEK